MKEYNGLSISIDKPPLGESSGVSDTDWKTGLKQRLHPKQLVWDIVLLGIAAGFFVPAFLFTLGGLIVYLWIIPLAVVPVIALQILTIGIAGFFALALSKTVVDAIRHRPLKTEEELSLTGHLLGATVFIIAFFGSPLYFLNIISLVLGTVLLWKGKHKLWRGLGFVVLVWVMLVQFYIFTSLWR